MHEEREEGQDVQNGRVCQLTPDLRLFRLSRAQLRAEAQRGCQAEVEAASKRDKEGGPLLRAGLSRLPVLPLREELWLLLEDPSLRAVRDAGGEEQ